jgi:hypothetical protein
MDWNDTRCEGDQEERIKEMMSDGHVKEILDEATSLIVQAPEIVILYQVTCGGCESRLTDSDPMYLAVDYRCDECNYVTKTIDGNLGHLSVMLPPALRDKFLNGLKDT